MTCVLPTTPFHHFNDHLPWLPMNPDAVSTQPPLDKSSSQGYVSPGSDTRKSSTSSGKKRASRAGTRSVTTLSAAQLERKRANDREAQRAIRQRTKDHIDHLERTVTDLRGSHEQNEKVVHVTQQRNRELEDENAYLRSKLTEAGFNVNLLSDNPRPDGTLLGVPAASPATASGARSGSNSTPSSHSATTQGSTSRHGSWQPQPGFVGTAMGLPSAIAVANTPNLTTWRSQENTQGLQQDSLQGPSPINYQTGERVEWNSNPSTYSYASHGQQRPQYETAPPHQQQGFPQSFGASTTSQPSTYQTHLTAQSDFPNVAVSSGPSSFQVQGQPTFQQPTSFNVSPMQVPTGASEFNSPHGQMQPPPLPNNSFHPSSSEPSFGPGHAATSMPFRDEGAPRNYPLTHYPAA